MINTLLIEDNGKTYVFPGEDKEVILHNPDMGWAIYDNHAMIARPLPTGEPPIVASYDNHLELREDDYDFPGVDNIVLILTWSDIEIEKDVYDFTYFDAIYDFWKKRGKNILLGMSTTTKVWYGLHGQGAPTYLIEYLKPDGVYMRSTTHPRLNNGITYNFYVCDVGNPYYLERLRIFLCNFAKHLKETRRPISYIDLRGYGMWGEWHTGFQYPDLETKRKALGGVLDAWVTSFPDAYLAISYSHDPDSPYEYYHDPNRFEKFLEWSAYDLAMQYPNVTLRRDGVGQALQNNERIFGEEVFREKKRGPFTSEACFGCKPRHIMEYQVTDGLTLHPNYFTVIGWGGSECQKFIETYPDLIDYGLRHMGYRFVITNAAYESKCERGSLFAIDTVWLNRAVGRAARNYEVQIMLESKDGLQYKINAGECGSSNWVKDEEYSETYEIKIPTQIPTGIYRLGIALYDAMTGVCIKLALKDKTVDEAFYGIGSVEIV